MTEDPYQKRGGRMKNEVPHDCLRNAYILHFETSCEKEDTKIRRAFSTLVSTVMIIKRFSVV